MQSIQRQFPSTIRKSRERYSGDANANDEFMSGMRDSASDDPESLRRAVEQLSRAVQRDPDFALAHATLSYTCMNIHYRFEPHHSWLDRAEDHCRRALELDSLLPEAHFARAYILWSPAKNFLHVEAIAALQQVLALQPNFERAHNRLATICWHIGRLNEARTACEYGQRSNAKNRMSREIVWVNLYSGDFKRATEEAEAWIEESPRNEYALTTRSYLALLNGDLPLAEQRIDEALRVLPEEPLIVSLKGLLHARRNEAPAALTYVRKALELPGSLGHTHHTYYQLAGVYAVLGETSKAMAWLDRAAETGFACWPFFKIDPHLESLRQLPEFQKLVSDLELRSSTLTIERL